METKEEKRKAILEFLRSEGSNDPEADHSKAEKMLLDFIGDDEITEAWNNTPQTWWYA